MIGIKGMVISRPKDAINSKMPTGEIDIKVNEIVVYNEDLARSDRLKIKKTQVATVL